MASPEENLFFFKVALEMWYHFLLCSILAEQVLCISRSTSCTCIPVLFSFATQLIFRDRHIGFPFRATRRTIQWFVSANSSAGYMRKELISPRRERERDGCLPVALLRDECDRPCCWPGLSRSWLTQPPMTMNFDRHSTDKKISGETAQFWSRFMYKKTYCLLERANHRWCTPKLKNPSKTNLVEVKITISLL